MTSRQILSEAHFVPALAIHAALSLRSISSVLSVLIRDFSTILTILEIWAVLIGDIFQQGARSTCCRSFTLLARVGLLAVLMEHLTIKSIFVGQFNFHSEVVQYHDGRQYCHGYLLLHHLVPQVTNNILLHLQKMTLLIHPKYYDKYFDWSKVL